MIGGLQHGSLDFTERRAPAERWDRLPDGGFLLNSGWNIKPAGDAGAGRHIAHEHRRYRDNGKFLLVLNGGYNPPTRQRDRHSAEEGTEPDQSGGCVGWDLPFRRWQDKFYVGGGTTGKVFELQSESGYWRA